MSPAASIPCAIRPPKGDRAAAASSTCTGLKSPVTSANAITSASVTVFAYSALAPTASSSMPISGLHHDADVRRDRRPAPAARQPAHAEEHEQRGDEREPGHGDAGGEAVDLHVAERLEEEGEREPRGDRRDGALARRPLPVQPDGERRHERGREQPPAEDPEEGDERPARLRDERGD